MTVPLNWSERPEPNAAGLKDCTYAAGLTAMVYAGWTAFKHGIYSVEEREQLERSDTRTNETGATLTDLILAIKTRYGKTRVRNDPTALPALLVKTGIGLVVQGHLSNFPLGHRLRRWQPSFTGGHAIFVMALGAGKWRWYDPLAPMRFMGDDVSTADVATFARTIGYTMTFKADEFVPPKLYTQAEMDTLDAKLTKATNDLVAAQAALKDALAKLAFMEQKITNAKTALG